MTAVRELAPNYRRTLDRWPTAPMLGCSYEALEACFSGNAHGLVEHIKSFLESVCYTILAEFGKTMPTGTPTTTELLVAALAPLGLQNTRGANKLDKVLGAFNRMADALSEMRNETGAVAHGRDGFLDPVSADHARAFLHIGDAILGVLLNAYEGVEPDLNFTREPYERFHHLNERIDRAVGVEARIDDTGDRLMLVVAVATGPQDEAIEIRIEPSRLLYGVDRSAYIEVLKSAVEPVVEEAEDATSLGGEELLTAPQEDLETLSHRGSLPNFVPTYSGVLASLKAPMEGFLGTEIWQSPQVAGESLNLADSLLATAEATLGLDWKQRESLVSGLKVAFRRVLSRFGYSRESLEERSDQLVTWMKIYAPDEVVAMQSQVPGPQEVPA